MKERCDNICETCPLQGQVYCSLKFAKATNLSLATLNERLESIEEMLQQNNEQILIDPLREPLDAGTGEDDKQI